MISRENIYYWKSDRKSAFEEIEHTDQDTVQMEVLVQKVLETFFEGKAFSFCSAHGQGNHMTYLVNYKDVRYFLRLENGQEKDNYMEVESEVLNKVRSVGVPTPQVYLVDASRTKVPFTYQIMEYIPYPDLNSLYKKKTLDLLPIAEKIGRNIAKWQFLTFSGFGPFNNQVLRQERKLVGIHRHYRDYFFLNLDQHLNFLVSHRFFDQNETREIRGVIMEKKELLSLERGCLVHKDLALWNMLGSHQEIKAIIDWDDTISGDPMDDISLLACFHSQDVINEVLRGYSNVMGSLPENYLGRFWLHLLRNMIVKAVIRVGGDYFNKRDDFFLIDTGHSGASLEEQTKQRIKIAIRGLRENLEINKL